MTFRHDGTQRDQRGAKVVGLNHLSEALGQAAQSELVSGIHRPSWKDLSGGNRRGASPSQADVDHLLPVAY